MTMGLLVHAGMHLCVQRWSYATNLCSHSVQCPCNSCNQHAFPPCNSHMQAILCNHLDKLPGEGIRELMGSKLTSVTVELYNFMCDKLPPTPSRFHYVFNLRDISRVYEGLLLSTPDKVGSCGPVTVQVTGTQQQAAGVW